jgi:hypothetical protein
VTDNVIELPYTQDQLIQAMHKYGERWSIQQTDDKDGWIAVERLPAIEPPQPRVATSRTLGGLVQKLRKY